MDRERCTASAIEVPSLMGRTKLLSEISKRIEEKLFSLSDRIERRSPSPEVNQLKRVDEAGDIIGYLNNTQVNLNHIEGQVEDLLGKLG